MKDWVTSSSERNSTWAAHILAKFAKRVLLGVDDEQKHSRHQADEANHFTQRQGNTNELDAGVAAHETRRRHVEAGTQSLSLGSGK
jgi:hypothetical protein